MAEGGVSLVRVPDGAGLLVQVLSQEREVPAEALTPVAELADRCASVTVTTPDGTSRTFGSVPASFRVLGDDTVAVRWVGGGAASITVVDVAAVRVGHTLVLGWLRMQDDTSGNVVLEEVLSGTVDRLP